MGRRPLGPDYLKLFSASAVSNLGDGVRWTALPLLAATLTRDPSEVAAIEVFAFLPWVLFSLVAGALVDRWDRRTVMVVANCFRAGVMGALAAAVATGSETLVLLYALAFALGVAETMFDNAAQAMLPSIVVRDDLERANGRMYAAEIVTNQFAGPPLGGLLFAAAAAAPFAADAASFAVAAAVIALVSGRARSGGGAADPVRRLRTDIGEGVRWLFGHHLLRALAIFLGLSNMMFTAAFAPFVLFALQILGTSEIGYGILLAAGAGGSAVGGLVGPAISRRTGGGPALVLALVLSGSSLLGTALTSTAWVAGAMGALTGFAAVVWNVITVSLRQAIIPDRLLGRVNGVYRLLGWGTMPLGAALGGALADAYGLRAPFFAGAGVYAVMAVVAVRLLSNRAIRAARGAT